MTTTAKDMSARANRRQFELVDYDGTLTDDIEHARIKLAKEFEVAGVKKSRITNTDLVRRMIDVYLYDQKNV